MESQTRWRRLYVLHDIFIIFTRPVIPEGTGKVSTSRT